MVRIFPQARRSADLAIGYKRGAHYTAAVFSQVSKEYTCTSAIDTLFHMILSD